MKQRQTSFAFLMEMLWVCGFFILTSCIFLLAFVKADKMSLNARNLNQAVLCTENALEDVFASYEVTLSTEDTDSSEYILFFDKNWQAAKDTENAAFSITVSTAYKDGILSVSAKTHEAGGAELYALRGARYLPD